jgi:hypothetical protein
MLAARVQLPMVDSCFAWVVCRRCRYIQHHLLSRDAAETAHLFNAFFYKRYTTVGRKKVGAVAARCIRDVNRQMFVAVRNAARATSAACRYVPQSTLVQDVGIGVLAQRRASARRCVRIVQAYASVERWTAGVNLFQKKIVFVPIHRRSLAPPAIAPSGRIGRCFRTCCPRDRSLHWSLAVIHDPHNCIDDPAAASARTSDVRACHETHPANLCELAPQALGHTYTRVCPSKRSRQLIDGCAISAALVASPRNILGTYTRRMLPLVCSSRGLH